MSAFSLASARFIKLWILCLNDLLDWYLCNIFFYFHVFSFLVFKHAFIRCVGWRRGSVVRTSVCSWRTFPDLRLIHGWRVTTLWVRGPLWVNQLGQLSLLSFRGRKWVVIHVITWITGVETIKRQARTVLVVVWLWGYSTCLRALPTAYIACTSALAFVVPTPLESRYVTWGAMQVLYAFAFALILPISQLQTQQVMSS